MFSYPFNLMYDISGESVGYYGKQEIWRSVEMFEVNTVCTIVTIVD